MRKLYVAALVALWLFGWASTPDAPAAHALEDVASQPHKVFARAILILILLIWFARNSTFMKRNSHALLLPISFFVYNLVILPVSAHAGYSLFRLVEFALVVGTAVMIAMKADSELELRNRLMIFFGTWTVALLLLSILFITNPELGGKAAGLDLETQTFRYRLGGDLLRVDLAAALAGVCSMFWLFGALLERWTSRPVALSGLACSVTAMVLSYSRASLILATVIALIFLLRVSQKWSVKLLLLLIAVLILPALNIDQLSSFYLRGESQENVFSLSGRTFIANALWDANPWYSLMLGNGYLMNSPAGLFFPVPELYASMASPHDGYFAVLLGSGVVGVVLVLFMNLNMFRWFRIARSRGRIAGFTWTMPAYLYLAGITFFDYGVWGVTSPALLTFFVLYLTLWRLKGPAVSAPFPGREQSHSFLHKASTSTRRT
jgi:O-antigen ligase